jgi:enamine deaminase RidA (YjgF/YER057c/UK114 family)
MALLSRFSIFDYCAGLQRSKVGSTAVPSSQMEEVMRALLAITASMFIAASVFGTFDSVRAQDKAGPEAKLKAMGIDVTKYESRPVANYSNGVQVGNLLFMSGVGPRNPDGTGIIGKVGAELTTEQGYQAARLVGLVMLANVRQTLGSLDRVKRVVRVQGMVNATPDFKEQAKVVDGFSDLMVEVLGDQGRGARLAPGMGSLPFQVAVICEAIFEVE